MDAVGGERDAGRLAAGAGAIDLASPGPCSTTDPHPFYAALRAERAVQKVTLAGGVEAWLVLRYTEAVVALTDPRLRKDWSAAAPDLRQAKMGDGRRRTARLGRHMLNSDPPDHGRLRGVVSGAFGPRRLGALRPRIQEIADELIDGMPMRGEADLMESLAFPLPITVICELLGVPPEHGTDLHRWSAVILGSDSDSEETRCAVGEMRGYLARLVAERRRRPTPDLLGDLVRAADAGRLSEDELQGTVFLLVSAGHETTASLIGNSVLALLRHPGQLAALRADWSLLDDAVEEVLRYDGPLEATTWRFTTEDVELGGTAVPGGGSLVLVALASCDRDERRFPDPAAFDIGRARGRHLAFGHGIHYCLGAPLARMEAQIAIRTLFEKRPGLMLALDPRELARRPGVLLGGVERLPVRFSPP
ncbi:hypothetical protein ACG83_38845 [Frankia sp. R43]|nr:hypothetical protein ACG83_38845 [Frankia sp. R43]